LGRWSFVLSSADSRGTGYALLAHHIAASAAAADDYDDDVDDVDERRATTNDVLATS